MLGKALNDPIKGVDGADAGVGIQFTEPQKKQIKTLVATGHTLEAQKLILRELNKEVGGRAAAAGKTFAGSGEHPPQHAAEPGRCPRREADADRFSGCSARWRSG